MFKRSAGKICACEAYDAISWLVSNKRYGTSEQYPLLINERLSLNLGSGIDLGRSGAMPCLRIFIADDHDLIRRGIKVLFSGNPAWNVCGEASDGLESVAQCERLKPDVAILDFNMPGLNGLEAAKKIRNLSPQTEVLMLTIESSNQLMREAVAAGVRGYILKRDCDRELSKAIKSLESHRTYFTDSAVEEMIRGRQNGKRKRSETLDGLLTAREREIIKLISEGNSARKIAESLGISSKTVETHRQNLLRKLQIHNTPDLMRYAIRNHIVSP